MKCTFHSHIQYWKHVHIGYIYMLASCYRIWMRFMIIWVRYIRAWEHPLLGAQRDPRMARLFCIIIQIDLVWNTSLLELLRYSSFYRFFLYDINMIHYAKFENFIKFNNIFEYFWIIIKIYICIYSTLSKKF